MSIKLNWILALIEIRILSLIKTLNAFRDPQPRFLILFQEVEILYYKASRYLISVYKILFYVIHDLPKLPTFGKHIVGRITYRPIRDFQHFRHQLLCKETRKIGSSFSFGDEVKRCKSDSQKLLPSFDRVYVILKVYILTNFPISIYF